MSEPVGGEDKAKKIEDAVKGAGDFIKDAVNPDQAKKLLDDATAKLGEKAPKVAEFIKTATDKEGPFAGIISKIKETVMGFLGKSGGVAGAAAAATAAASAAIPKAAGSVKETLSHGVNQEELKEKASGIVNQLKSAGQTFGAMGNGNKAAVGGGALATLDGARRVAGGLKKDENGKRNLKVAFVGAVETAIGAVTTVAAFKAHGAGTNFADYVKSAAGRGGEGRSA